MNKQEEALLNTIFELSDDALSEVEKKTPADLHERLYDIAEGRPRYRWTRLKLASVAASVLICFLIYGKYQHISTKHKAEQTRQELLFAFQQLEHAQVRAHPYISNSLRHGVTQATIKPIIKSTQSIHL